ncbi:MAG TPA: glycine--tRNA ligase subunit beta, partial [Plasticicumulans sp.]|nr:glycine--tRNA ligase subunit beta [Plasticicumulans sp.]
MSQVETNDLLVEIGTEELPPKALPALSEAFEAGIRDGLAKAGLNFGAVHRYAAPRRLAVLVHELPMQQPERRLERRGPAVSAAFGPDGRPTKATEGFARSCGVEVAALTRV